MELLHIVCSDPNVDLKVQMGDGPATPSAGLASWEVVERVEGKGITDQIGAPPFQQDVPVFLDGYAKGNSVQRQLKELESLGGEDPAVFRAFGPIHRSGIRYVYGGEPDYGEAIRDNDGTLLRQRLTLKLMEFVDPDVIRRRKKHRDRMGIGQAKALTYTVRAGDTLQKIAAALYGDWKEWKSLGAKNGIRDPYKKLEPGRVLKV